MNSKRTFKNFFITRVPIFILLFILSFSLSFLAFNLRFALKEYEKIQVFSTTYGLRYNYGEEMQSDLKSDGVLDVFLYDYHPETNNLYTYFTTHGAKSDFHLINLQTLEEMQDVVQDYYLELDEAVMGELDESLILGYNFYNYENSRYGIALYQHFDSEYNNKFTYEEAYAFCDNNGEGDSYYLLINKNSVNIKGYNESATTKNTFKALNWLLERFNHEI